MCLLVSHSVSVSESRSPPFGSRWARGVRSQPRRPSPCQQPLDLPKEGAPGLFLFSFFLSLASISLPAPALPRPPEPPTPPPSCCLPFPAPQGKGVPSVSPRRGLDGRGGGVMCVSVTVASTLRSLAIRGCFRWVSGVGDKGRESGPAFGRRRPQRPRRRRAGLIC